jgi:hypothetical protein
MAFDPFARHRSKAETQPEPVQTQPIAEAVEIDPKSTADASAVETCPPSKPVEAPTARTDNPFGHHKVEPKDRPEPTRTQKPIAARELLHWIQRHWKKPVVSLRDVCVFGPTAIRDKASATKHVETLAQLGWLTEIPAHRRDRRLWRLPPAGAALPD